MLIQTYEGIGLSLLGTYECLGEANLKGFLMSLIPSLLWLTNHSCLTYLRSL